MAIQVSAPFARLIRGDTTLSQNESEMALQSREDRDAFVRWAASSMDVVDRSERLTSLYRRVLSIDAPYLVALKERVRRIFSFSSPRGLDPFARELHLNQRMISFSEAELIDASACIKSGLATPQEVKAAIQRCGIEVNEERLAFICQMEGMGLPLLLSAMRKPVLHSKTLIDLTPVLAKLPREEKLEVLLASKKEGSAPFFVLAAQMGDLESQSILTLDIIKDLVCRGLYLDSEDYLTLPAEAYRARVEALETLVRRSFADEQLQISLLRMIAQNERQEERLLLQYLSPGEKNKIAEAMNDPRLNEIAGQIVNGDWETLLQSYQRNAEFPFLVIAAYKLKKIDLEDLATAMMFHRVYFNTQDGDRMIFPINNKILESMDNLEMQDKALALQLAKQAKPNQRYVILVEKRAVDPYTQNVAYMTFLNGANKDVFGFLHTASTFGTFAFGVSQAHYKNLAPVIHLTPTMEAMEFHIRQNRSDFALHFSDETTTIHGSQDKTFFSPVHDLLHTHARNVRRTIQPDMMDLPSSMRISPAERDSYSRVMTDGVGTLYPRFLKMPTVQNMTAFVIDRIVGEVLDGGYQIERTASDWMGMVEETLNRVVENVFNYEIGKLPGTVSQEFRQAVRKAVYERCKMNPNSHSGGFF